ncbi:dTDP-4-dehydrorhamnose reductase [Alkaliphilus transvaalensis]|uniref:dTDP-4-dehydrorhamnose reductase n=1 Tax=Alkaliphilus transvaalensis TaxID=114628 RepID=UPI00047A9342|nr:dTDP-4-dehydrorhamnose reductase [Alkaliphilus transvaalensis]
MKICLIGGTGQLGNEINKSLVNETVYSFGSKGLDITNFGETYKQLKNLSPEIIIHAAGYTNIDRCEERPETAYQINTVGTSNVVKIAESIGSKLLYISSDYIFDGDKDSPYCEKDQPNPINVYGKTKLAAEEEIVKNIKEYYIVRTAWLYGHKGKSFVQSILSLAGSKSLINVIDDQRSCPTYGFDLAIAIKDLIATDDYGVYHFINEGDCTWYQLAQEICRLRKIEAKVNPIKSETLQKKAKRPKNSSLMNNSNIKLRPWQDALEAFLKSI